MRADMGEASWNFEVLEMLCQYLIVSQDFVYTDRPDEVWRGENLNKSYINVKVYMFNTCINSSQSWA